MDSEELKDTTDDGFEDKKPKEYEVETASFALKVFISLKYKIMYIESDYLQSGTLFTSFNIIRDLETFREWLKGD